MNNRTEDFLIIAIISLLIAIMGYCYFANGNIDDNHYARCMASHANDVEACKL